MALLLLIPSLFLARRDTLNKYLPKLGIKTACTLAFFLLALVTFFAPLLGVATTVVLLVIERANAGKIAGDAASMLTSMGLGTFTGLSLYMALHSVVVMPVLA